MEFSALVAARVDGDITRDVTSAAQLLIAEYIRGRSELLAYVTAMCADGVIAEDIVQDVGIKVLEWNEPKIPEVPAAWLRTVARHRWIDVVRRDARRSQHEQVMSEFSEAVELAWSEIPSTPGSNADEAAVAALRQCLEILPPRARELANLRYQEDLSLADIAQRMAWSAAAVKTGLAKIRQRLAACVDRRLALRRSASSSQSQCPDLSSLQPPPTTSFTTDFP